MEAKDEVKHQDYVAKTDEELKQIARDLVKGNIFCDRQIPDIEKNMGTFVRVFIPLGLMSKEELRPIKDTAYFIYEYIKDALPRSFNGYPMFHSFRYLNKEDSDKMFVHYERYKVALGE